MSQETLTDHQDHRMGTTRNIVFVAFPDVQMLNVCGPFDAFSLANRAMDAAGMVDRPLYRNEVVAAQSGPLRTASGLEIVAHHAYTEIDYPIDTLIVTGGVAALERAASDAALVAWIREAAPRARRVASVCTGAFLLAAGGLLEGRRATTHWGWTKQLADAYPSISVEPDRIFVRDGKVYTSAGITAGIDLALALVEEDLGRDIARLTARIMVMFLRRPGGQSQFSTYLGSEADALRDSRWFQTWVLGEPDRDQGREPLTSLTSVPAHSRPDMRGLQAWILAHPHADLSIEALAERVAMSPRNFARLFVQETGMTPAKFVEQARLEAARWSRRPFPSRPSPSAAGSVIPSACAGASVGCSGSARTTTARASSLRYCNERLLMGGYSPVIRPGGCLEERYAQRHRQHAFRASH